MGETRKTDFEILNEKLDDIIKVLNSSDVEEEIPVEPEQPQEPEIVYEDKCIIDEGDFAGLKTANELMNAVIAGWNLGNTLDCVGNGTGLAEETSWGNVKTTQEIIDAVKAKGFNSIRVPVTWSQHIDWTSEELTIQPEWIARVKEVVDYCYNNDMLVIINCHHDDAVYGNGAFEQWQVLNRSFRESVVSNIRIIWKQIAEAFKEYDGRLLFEGWNEIQHTKQDWKPANEAEWKTLNAMSQAFVDTVRKTGGNNVNRCLIINPPMTSGKDMIERMIIPTDVVPDRIIISGHPYTDLYDEDLLTRFTDWVKMKELYGVPTLFGEMGTTGTVNRWIREMNAYNYAAYGRQFGIPLYWWDAADFAMLDRVGLVWNQESVIDNLIAGAKSGVPKEFECEKVTLNDIELWQNQKEIDEKTGEVVDINSTVRVLKNPIEVKAGYMCNVNVQSGDDGYRIKNYAFYDAGGNCIFAYGAKNAKLVSCVVPNGAKYFNFSFHNPWGGRNDGQVSRNFKEGYLNISVKLVETEVEFDDPRLQHWEIDNDIISNKNNWKLGEYNYTAGAYRSVPSRVCTKGYFKVTPGDTLTYSINASDAVLVVRSYSETDNFVANKGTWNPGKNLVIKDNEHYISLTLYSPKNTYTNKNQWDELFDSGLRIEVSKVVTEA